MIRNKSHATAPDPTDGQNVGIIAMLFSGPVVTSRPCHMDQAEQDFMLALFLQKQEDENNNRSGNSRRRPLDPDVGHFCAPNTPGFCEANFCIFHTKDD